MSSKLLIKGASVWRGGDFSPATDLLIDAGRIARLGQGLADPKARVIDAADWIVLPGLVDLHAHLGEPGHETRESIHSGLLAAAAGGFTHVLAMPDTNPPVDNEATVEFLRQRGELAQAATLHVCGALTKGREGTELAELAHLVGAGAKALGDARYVRDPSMMRRALLYARMLGVPVMAQTGDEILAGDGAVHEGPVGHWLGLPGIPPSAEWTSLARDLLLAEEVGGRLHVQGVSTARSLEIIADAKRRGVQVSAEVNLYNLLFDDGVVADYDTSKKVMPPLRPAKDVQALIDGLNDGVIDCIATDHTPWTIEEKDVEFELAPFGAAGLELALSALYSELVLPGKLSWRTLVDALSTRPRRIIGLPHVEIAEGAPCDLTLFAPGETYRVEPEKWRSQSRNTPLSKATLEGRVQGTLIGERAVGFCFDQEGPRDGRISP